MMIPKNRESSGIAVERRTTHGRNQKSYVGSLFGTANKTRSLAMPHGKLFDRDFALLETPPNLIFIGTFQPQLDRFFDDCFGVAG